MAWCRAVESAGIKTKEQHMDVKLPFDLRARERAWFSTLPVSAAYLVKERAPREGDGDEPAGWK